MMSLCWLSFIYLFIFMYRNLNQTVVTRLGYNILQTRAFNNVLEKRAEMSSI